MSAPGRMAFANVRARARAARLLGPETAAHLRAAKDPAARAAAFRPWGGEGGPADLRRALLSRLVEDYTTLAASYPIGAPLIVALARLHEIENLDLLFRAARHSLPVERWRPLWQPLGRLGSLRLADAVEVRHLRDLARIAASTPYADVVATVAGGPSPDPSTAELSFDRFASQQLVDEARRLPRAEVDARALVLDLVRERDLDAVRRAVSYGIAPEQAAGTAVLLPEERGWDRLADLAAWTPDDGPMGLLLPHRFLGGETPVADWAALQRAVRRLRRRRCGAAFIGSPFRVAPGIAYLLLAEEEVRGLTALAEAAGDPAANDTVALALAGCALGD